MMEVVVEVLTATAALCAPIVLLGAALILLLEVGVLAGILLPGGSTVLAAGSLVGAGQLQLAPSVLVLFVASTAGAHFAFARCRREIARGAVLPAGAWILGLGKIHERAQRVFSSDVHVGTVLAHLVGGTRTIGPRLAAASSLTYRNFAVFNALGAAVWVSALLGMGAVAGANPVVMPWVIGGVVMAGLLFAAVRYATRCGKFVATPGLAVTGEFVGSQENFTERNAHGTT